MKIPLALIKTKLPTVTLQYIKKSVIQKAAEIISQYEAIILE